MQEEKEFSQEKEKKEELYQMILKIASHHDIPQKDLDYLHKNIEKIEANDLSNILGHLLLDYSWKNIIAFVKERIKYYQDDFKISKQTFKKRYFDEAWKDILWEFLEDIIKITHAPIWEEVDWSQKPENLCQELDRLSFLSKTPGRIVDALFKVHLKKGGTLTILLHFEVQIKEEKDFAKRICQSQFRIIEKYDTPVYSIAMVSYPAKEEKGHYHYSAWDLKVGGEFKILDLYQYYKKPELLLQLKAQKNIMAWVIEIHLSTYIRGYTQENMIDFWKRICTELQEAGFTKEKLVSVLDFMDWLKKPTDEESKKILDILKESEGGGMIKRTYGPILSQFAKECETEGEIKGKIEGKIETVFLLLNTSISLSIEKEEDFKKRMLFLNSEMIHEIVMLAIGKSFQDEEALEKWILEKEKEMAQNKAA